MGSLQLTIPMKSQRCDLLQISGTNAVVIVVILVDLEGVVDHYAEELFRIQPQYRPLQCVSVRLPHLHNEQEGIAMRRQEFEISHRCRRGKRVHNDQIKFLLRLLDELSPARTLQDLRKRVLRDKPRRSNRQGRKARRMNYSFERPSALQEFSQPRQLL